VSDLADELGLSKLKAQYELTKSAHSDIVKWKRVLITASQYVREQAEKFATGAMTDIEKLHYIQQVSQVAELTKMLKGVITNYARATSAGRIKIETVENLDIPKFYIPGKGYKLATEMSLADFAASSAAKENVAALNSRAAQKRNEALMTAQSLGQIVKAVESHRSFLRTALEARMKALLTGPRTHIANVIGNTANLVLEDTINLFAAGIGHLRGQNGYTLGEATASISGVSEAAVKMFTRSVGVKPSEIYKARHEIVDNPSVADLIMDMVIHPMAYVEGTAMDDRSRLEMETLGRGKERPGQSAYWLQTTTGRAIAKAGSVIMKPGAAGINLARKIGGVFKGVDVENMTSEEIFTHILDGVDEVQTFASFGMLELEDRVFSRISWQKYVNETLIGMGLTGEDLTLWKTKLDTVRNDTERGMLDKDVEKAAFPKKLDEETFLTLTPKEQVQYIDKHGDDYLTSLDEEARKAYGLAYAEAVELDTLRQIDEQAMEYSNRMTWKGELQTNVGRRLEQLFRSAPILKLFVPFFHTPAAILDRVISLTPGVGLFNEQFRSDLLGLGPELGKEAARDKAIATWVVGTGLYALGAYLVYSNKVTPSAVTSDQARQMREAGVQQHSIKIGDKWIDINKLDPVFTPFGLLADAANILRIQGDPNGTAIDTASLIFASILRTITQKTWMTSINDLMTAINDGTGDKAQAYIAKTAESFVPFGALVNNLDQTKLWPGYDPHYYKEAETAIEKAPYLSGLKGPFSTLRDALTQGEEKPYLRPSLDSYGKMVDTPMTIAGLKYTEKSDSPIRQEVLRLGINLRPANETFQGYRMSSNEHWQMQRKLDEVYDIEGKLSKLVTSIGWDRRSDLEKKQAIQAMYTHYVQVAKYSMVKDDAEVKLGVAEARLKAREERKATNKSRWAPW
jgi:hypothetical protein